MYNNHAVAVRGIAMLIAAAMEKTIAMLGSSRTGRRASVSLRCLQTDEVATLADWAKRIAAQRGCVPKSVYNHLNYALRQAMGKPATAYGLDWSPC